LAENKIIDTENSSFYANSNSETNRLMTIPGMEELFAQHRLSEEAWDQFNLNKEKFNVESTYSENTYTTTLNMDEIPEELRKDASLIEEVGNANKI
jgi:hypothetical protein